MNNYPVCGNCQHFEANAAYVIPSDEGITTMCGNGNRTRLDWTEKHTPACAFFLETFESISLTLALDPICA